VFKVDNLVFFTFIFNFYFIYLFIYFYYFFLTSFVGVDPSLMTEKLKKIISRSDDRYSSREKIISGLGHFGFKRDSLKKISFRLDDYSARKLKV
jgi:hypothetical protein